jgi:hypothetical protein
MNGPLSKEQLRRRNYRNIAVFLALAVFVILVYAITIVKIKAGQG